jgi:UDP-4-amino-4,6-dideoxy-N-acetyl-beta-L-altrosamine N-acetyltransferase
MQINKYGIQLSSLESKDLELVRHWRNATKVRPFMQHTEIISEEEQIQWFENLSREENFYFIISYSNQKIGVVNIKAIDVKTKVGEAGIFFGDNQFTSTMIPFLSTISLMDFAFDVLGLKALQAKIKRDNLKVIDFNRSLGYKLIDTNMEDHFDYYSIEEKSYKFALKKWANLINKWDIDYQIILSREECDFLKDSFQFEL